jgi:hypothetical protein
MGVKESRPVAAESIQQQSPESAAVIGRTAVLAALQHDYPLNDLASIHERDIALVAHDHPQRADRILATAVIQIMMSGPTAAGSKGSSLGSYLAYKSAEGRVAGVKGAQSIEITRDRRQKVGNAAHGEMAVHEQSKIEFERVLVVVNDLANDFDREQREEPSRGDYFDRLVTQAVQLGLPAFNILPAPNAYNQKSKRYEAVLRARQLLAYMMSASIEEPTESV